jgi:predicted anti-sigma-YlaC factor YlaD
VSTPHPDPDDLALAALPAESPDPKVVAHLAECPTCRGRVAELAHTVALAKEGAVDADEQAAPEHVWAAIEAELGASRAPQTERVACPPCGPIGRARVLSGRHPSP